MTTLPRFTYYLIVLQAAFSLCAQAQGSAFTYQGSLSDNGSPTSGIYDLRFALYDVETNGVAISVLTNAATPVVDGLFTVTLDFGAGVFDGSDRWLEIGATTNGGGVFSTLSPRQPINSTPYAIMAANAATVSGTVAASQLTGTISSNNIGDGSITSVMLGNGAVGTDQLADGATTADKIASVTEMALMKSIFNPTPASGDKFGYSVAALGTDKMIIGATEDDLGAPNAGVVYLYSTAGALLNTLTNPTPAAGDFFGHKVAGLGADKVLVGAFSDDTTGTNSGSVYLFNTAGTLLTTFANPTPANNDYFGIAVAAVGADKVLIGAHGDDVGGMDAGVAYLFSTNGTLLNTFTNPTPVAGEQFGLSLAAVGLDKVILGSAEDDLGAIDSGVAYLFSTNGTLLNTFTNPTPASSDYFGNAVAGVGPDKVLIGAVLDDAVATNSGVAYLFSTTGTLLNTFTNPTPQSGDLFGYTVAGAGADKVLIGALQDDTGAADAGAVYLFSTDGTLLNTFVNPSPVNGYSFGWALAAVGMDQVLIGAPQDDTGATDSGTAYLYGPTSYTPGLVAEGVAPNAVGSLEIIDGSITAADVDATSFHNTFWQTGGNAGTTPGATFLGTTDNQALEFKVNNQIGLRLEYPTVGTMPNLVGGFTGNSVGAESEGAVISGGGTSGSANSIGVDGDYNVIGGGRENKIDDISQHATIAGGHNNTIGTGSGSSVIGGGYDNDIGANSQYATVVGGLDNNIGVNCDFSVIGGGWNNIIDDYYSKYSVIAGGLNNNTSGDYAMVPGGRENVASGDYSFAAGYGAKANHNGSFVWADSSSLSFGSSANDQFLIRAAGGVGIGTTNPATKLDVNGTVTAIAFNPTSDRNLKENFKPVSALDVLNKVASMPISRWNFIGDEATPHVGPMAQDFRAAFGLGTDERHIATVDADGVALAAIQGLNEKVESGKQKTETRMSDLEDQLEQKDAEIAEMKQTVNELKELVNAINHKLNGGAQ